MSKMNYAAYYNLFDANQFSYSRSFISAHYTVYYYILCGYIIEEFEDTKGVHIILHIQLKI